VVTADELITASAKFSKVFVLQNNDVVLIVSCCRKFWVVVKQRTSCGFPWRVNGIKLMAVRGLKGEKIAKERPHGTNVVNVIEY